MTLPGHTTTIAERTRAKTAAPSTANGFMVGFTERGPINEAVLIRSLAEYVEIFGGRVSYGALYDSVDAACREGASAIYVSRIVGPAPVKATANLLNASDVATLRVDALSEGAWANSITVDVVLSAGSFVLTVKYAGTIVEASPALADEPEAIAWAQANSNYIRLVDVGTAGDPKTQAAVALATGTDDHLNSTDATRLAAMNRFARDLGAGQVAAPGFTTTQAYIDLLAHAAANNRRALLDGADTPTVSTLITASLALRSAANNGARFGQLLAPWAIIPGLSAGTTRTVPYSAVQMGLIAAAEGETGNPNKAAAGKRGRSAFATGLSQPPWTDADRETLNDSGVSVARVLREVVTTYGNRTLANPITDGDWRSFSASRLVMAVAAACETVMEDYDFEQIDGKGFVFAKLAGDLSGRACMPFYLSDALFGDTPAEAFTVNTGPDVNTASTIANEEIHASVGIKVSPTGEELNVEIVKVPESEAL